MNRPYLVNFSAIASDNKLVIHTGIANAFTPVLRKGEKPKSQTPIQSIRLFSKDIYRIRVIGHNNAHDTLFEKEFDSDNFGNFNITTALTVDGEIIEKLSIFEINQIKGLSFHLGTFIPLVINDPKKILISDFDKTLVDTKYSTTKEMYYSLNKPLAYFPTVEKSVNLLRRSVEEGFQPFVLSASPHFYENSIRDWLYQNKIYAGNLYLKDYRHIFSVFDGILAPKDIKKQGFYKLNQLVTILLMVGIPDELILMGDGFESDPMIYLILLAIFETDVEPWQIWKSIKHTAQFKLTTKQNSQFLTQVYKITDLIKKKKSRPKIQIYIRTKESDYEEVKNNTFKNPIINKLSSTIQYYAA